MVLETAKRISRMPDHTENQTLVFRYLRQRREELTQQFRAPRDEEQCSP